MSGRELSRLDLARVEHAKKLLADIGGMGFDDTRDAYALLGRTQAVVAGLIETVEGGGPE